MIKQEKQVSECLIKIWEHDCVCVRLGKNITDFDID